MKRREFPTSYLWLAMALVASVVGIVMRVWWDAPLWCQHFGWFC